MELLKLTQNAMFMTVYMFVATLSIGFSKKTQSKTNIGKDMIKFFLDNHLLYVWVCVIIWSATLYNCYYLMYINSLQFVNPET